MLYLTMYSTHFIYAYMAKNHPDRERKPASATAWLLFPISPLNYFSFQPVLHDWCNKCLGICYPVCGVMHIKEPLLLIGKSSPCGGSEFPLSGSLPYV